MSLQSDKQIQKGETLSKLKAASRSVLQNLETPQKAVIAHPIPKEQWEAFQEYLQAVILFQPEIYSELSKRVTEEQIDQIVYDRYANHQEWLENWSEKFGDRMVRAVQRTVPDMENLIYCNEKTLAQDGKKREEYLNKLNSDADEKLTAMKKLIAELKIWIMLTISISAGLSMIVSLIVSLNLK